MPSGFFVLPRFNSIKFFQISLKLSYFSKKSKIFRVLAAPFPDPKWPPADGDVAVGPPKQPFTPLQSSAYAPGTKRVLLILPNFRILLRVRILLREFIDLVKHNNRYLE